MKLARSLKCIVYAVSGSEVARCLEALRMSRRQTDFFSVDSGVRHGDSLSPLLFNIVLDFVMRRVELAGGGIEWSAGRRLRNLA